MWWERGGTGGHPSDGSLPPVLIALAGPLAISVAGAVMLARTWRTWPDPLVDFGREVYLAWQVAEGRTLYRDVVHFNGPLSAYVNALVFRVLGPGILGVALANAAFAAACIAMLYVLVVRTADRLGATFAGLTFVTVFACSRYVPFGNYNWLCPYSYELTHGVTLAVAALWCLDRYHRTHRPAWMAASGVALGLVALTKAETLLAGACAITVGVGLTIATERPPWGRALRLLAGYVAGVLAPLALAFAYFASRMPAAEVLAWPLGYWHAAARPEFVSMPFYRAGLGIDDVSGNLRKMLLAGAAVGGVMLACAAIALLTRRASWPRLVTTGVGIAAFACARRALPATAWLAAARGLPVLLVVVLVGSLVAWVRTRRMSDEGDRAALRVSLAVLALVLLAKMALNVRVFHYGFALAMPATLVVVVAMVTWIPALLRRTGGLDSAACGAAVGILVAGLLAHVEWSDQVVARQTAVLGDGADAFFADGRAVPLAAALAEIRQRVAPTATLVILPEGVMLNYLARRASSVRYVQYNPVSVALWGESHMAVDLAASPPDFVLIIHREYKEEGARFFGQDYATSLMRFVEANYRPVWQTGATPLRDGRFGIVLLARARPPTTNGP